MPTPAIAIVLGTRPEAIKLAPVILELNKPGSPLRPVVCVTGQHRQMLDPVLDWFRITPEHDLNLMETNQALADLSARALTGVNNLLSKIQPDAVLVQGDTTTAAMAALAAFYLKIPVAHVEAGLRTHDLQSPFPEELNRRFLTLLTSLHFAPTNLAGDALRAEGVDANSIFVVGNTIVDALRLTIDRSAEIDPVIGEKDTPSDAVGQKLVLVTAHRRESFGGPFDAICRAIRTLAERNADIDVVYPVHLNPNVRASVSRLLEGTPRVSLIEPVSYQQMVQLLMHSHLVLTDSGGIQEEASVLGKPTLILRNNTERPEAITAGTAALAGTDPENIVAMAETILRRETSPHPPDLGASPFGDGYAALRIVQILTSWLYSRAAR